MMGLPTNMDIFSVYWTKQLFLHIWKWCHQNITPELAAVRLLFFVFLLIWVYLVLPLVYDLYKQLSSQQKREKLCVAPWPPVAPDSCPSNPNAMGNRSTNSK